ncbi:N-acetylmuramoyl-L-alanine amidase [Candidatus Dependentiae bacterium]
MKILLSVTFLFIFQVFGLGCFLEGKFSAPKKMNKGKFHSSINKLNWLEISNQRFSKQIMFDFFKPVYFERKLDKQKLVLEIIFPGIGYKDFSSKKVIKKLKKLRNVIKNVQIVSKLVPSPRLILEITFCSKDVLIRWSKMEDPNRLILDVFSKKSLEKLKSKGATLLYAYNNCVKNDFSEKLINLGLGKKKTKKSINIIVDAGHGGNDSGASGFFLSKEKKLTLDVARRTAGMLKKNGYKVCLTRNSDKDLTLLQRSELAEQLKADLFLSIHVNAVKGIERVSGIESYYLKSDNLLPPGRIGGFFFAFNKHDTYLSKVADNLLKNNINLSKKLATSIQNNLMNFLKSKKFSIVNRGIKSSQFRILLRSQIPVALIEIGFLTNKKEAKRLINYKYRQILAEGIAKGVQQYLGY